jgi:phosphoribosylglycinamide formyltransferase 1
LKKKIIIISSNSFRHKYLACLISNEKNFNLVKCYLENNKLNKIQHLQNDYLNNYLKRRDKYELLFFKDYVQQHFKNVKKKYVGLNQINSKIIINEIVKIKPDFIICYGCSIIRNDLISKYRGKILNIHLGFSPFRKGAGTNFFPFFEGKLEFLGVTFLELNEKIDEGKIIHHVTPNLQETDNIHTAGFALIKKSFQELLKILSFGKFNSKYYKKNIKSKIYKRKDFDEKKLKIAEENLKKGLIKKYLLKKNKITKITHSVFRNKK